MNKWIIFAIILVTLGVGVWVFYPYEEAPKPETSAPETSTVERKPLRVTVEATGRVVPAQEIEIKCKASGEVIKLPKDISDPVTKGELLVQLDPTDEKRSVQRAEATLAISEATLQKAKLSFQIANHNLLSEESRVQAALRSAEASYDEADKKRTRAKDLHGKHIISKDELESVVTSLAQADSSLADAKAAVTDLDATRLEIESLAQDIKIAQAGVASDKLALSDAKQRLDDTTVLAPIDGVVAEREVQVGQIIASGINNVGGGTTVLKLIDPVRLFVLVSVDESDIGQIVLDQPARILVDAYPGHVFPGTVVRVATKGVSTTNIVTFEVKVEVGGKAIHLLKPEMTANVEILVVDKESALLAPVTALRRSKDQQVLLVADGETSFKEVPVEVGASDGEFIEITSGVKEGTIIQHTPGRGQTKWEAGSNDEARQKRRAERMKQRMMRGGKR